MTKAVFGWQNLVLSGAVSSSAELAVLGAGQLQNPHGATSTSWQSPPGTTSAWLQVDAGAVASWGAMSLHNTNLTPAATVRWRAGPVESFAAPVSLPTDSLAGASIGGNTIRVGTTVVADGSTATVYRNSSTSFAYVQAFATLAADVTYTLRVRAQRITGSGTAGFIVVAEYNGGAGLLRTFQTMAAVPATGPGEYSVTFTNRVAGTYAMYFFADSGSVGDVALWNASIQGVPTYDSGVLSGTVSPGYRQSVLVPTAAQSGRYLRCDISDPTNPEGFLRVAQMFGGPVVRPSANIGFQTAFSRAAQLPSLRSRGGQLFTDYRYSERAWAVSLPNITDAESWDFAQEMLRIAEDGDNVLLVPFPLGTNSAREAVFGPISGAAPMTYPAASAAWRSWACTITERL